MKKWLIAVLILVVLLGGGAFYWFSQQPTELVSEPVDAIPVNASVIIAYPDLGGSWSAFLEKDYHATLRAIDALTVYFSRNEELDSLLVSDAELSRYLGGATIWSSYHATADDSLEIFHVFDIKEGGEGAVVAAWKRNLTNLGGAITQEMVGENPVYKAVVSEPYSVTFFSTKNGLLLTSSSLVLIKQSLAQLSIGKSLLLDKNFRSAVEAAGQNVDANIYVNYAQLPPYLDGALKSGVTSVRAFVSQFADWSEFDLNLKDEGFTLNGFTYVNDSLPQFLSLFMNQKPQLIEFPDFIPSNTASFVFYGVDDVIGLSSEYRNLLGKQAELDVFEAKLDSVNKLLEVDLEQNLLAWLGNSFGMCITRPSGQSFAENSYVVFEARSVELAEKLLGGLATILTDKSGRKTASVEVGGVYIKELALQGVLADLFGETFKEYDNPFYAIENGFVVVGTSAESVADYVQYVQADRTLGKDLSFSRFVENLGSTFSMFSYNHIASSQKIFESYLDRDAAKALERNRKHIQKFEAVGTQFTTTGKSFYSSTFVKYNPSSENQKETHWFAQMAANPSIAPVFVKNHISGEPEIFVQDELNNIYLFNQLGQELFRAEVKEPILSKPLQVDAFKNGKLQYIFNTKNFIYLVDREGNLVDGYPIELNSPAETDLVVFDYDKDKDYRLLITCKNNHIYNYGIDGKKTRGWHHNRASDPTIHPFKRLLVSGKDYIVTGEDNGKIHLLDRRGKNRVKVEKRVVSSKNNHLEVFKSSEAALTGVYLTDETGKMHRVALDGDIQPMDLGKFSPEHHFLVSDLDSDSRPEFIFYDLNLLQAFNYKKEKLFEQRIEPEAIGPFLINLGGEVGIGFTYPESQQLVLFDSKGQMASGFPLSGTSEFDFLKTEEGSLVVTSAATAGLLIQNLH